MQLQVDDLDRAEQVLNFIQAQTQQLHLVADRNRNLVLEAVLAVKKKITLKRYCTLKKLSS